MTYRRIPRAPSRKQIANHLKIMHAMANNEPVNLEELEQPSRRTGPRGKQPESKVNDAVKEWARYRGDITLYRNNVGAIEWAPGKWLRYGLCVGSSDFIGWQSITITQDLVGKRIAVFVGVESKAPGGVLSEEQCQFIERVRDAGGIGFVARSIEDLEKHLVRKP